MGNHSTFLFATPGWTDGVGRLLDFANSLTEYNVSKTDAEADLRAITMDWRAVGQDIAWSVKQIAGEMASLR